MTTTTKVPFYDTEGMKRFRAELRKKNTEGFLKGLWKWDDSNRYYRHFFVETDEGRWELALYSVQQFKKCGRLRLEHETRCHIYALLVFKSKDNNFEQQAEVYYKRLKGEGFDRRKDAEDKMIAFVQNAFGIEVNRYTQFNH